jgi:uncharacterized protein (DUF488 family)
MGNDADLVEIFSVGHSHHDLARFLELLRGAGADAVADVRSQPYSRRTPQYNRDGLEDALRSAGVVYVFLGEELGGRPQDWSVYDGEGRVDYEKVRATYSFRAGLDRLEKARERYRPVLLCAEEDPLDCHRGLMVAPALAERGVRVGHIRGKGRVESMVDMEDRLLEETRLAGLFALDDEGRREALAEAYRAMARRKAFRVKGGPEAE